MPSSIHARDVPSGLQSPFKHRSCGGMSVSVGCKRTNTAITERHWDAFTWCARLRLRVCRRIPDVPLETGVVMTIQSKTARQIFP
jgi:hypothetical protein